MFTRLFTFLALLSTSAVTFGQQPQESAAETRHQKTQVMVLGTFHFSQVTPKNAMLSEKRQNEISDVLDRLEEFKPTKIFVERNPEFENVNKIGERYQKYLRGEIELSANEIYQIGFRLGKRLKHPAIFQADHPGRYGMYNSMVTAYAKKHNQMGILQGKAPGTNLGLHKTEDTDALQKKQTLMENLRFLNSERYERADHGWYVSTLPRVGGTDPGIFEDGTEEDEDEYFVGAEMLTNWYRRNIFIYSKVLTQMDFKEERILVVFGAGHSSTLKHLFKSNPHFDVVDTHAWLAPRLDSKPAPVKHSSSK